MITTVNHHQEPTNDQLFYVWSCHVGGNPPATDQKLIDEVKALELYTGLSFAELYTEADNLMNFFN